MTFKDIKEGGSVYILDKSQIDQDRLMLFPLKVESSTDPHYDSSIPGITDRVVDLRLSIPNHNPNLRYTFSEKDSSYAMDNIVICVSKEVALKELETFRDKSQGELDREAYNKKVVHLCDELLAEHNPVIKQKRETESRFKQIESNVGELKSDMGELKDMISQLLKKV